jgi:type I restriction enzyme S subunit
MKATVIRSGWMQENGLRLDGGPYLSGAPEAKAILRKLTARKDRLQDVTRGRMAGIFNGPRFARAYVDDPRYGAPFLGSTDILAADLSHLPLISSKQLAGMPELIVQENWTLITCSGTVGRMAYCRRDMAGMAGSQHFMRVVPDPDRIPPGYLYAFLASRFGVPLVVSGTYGAIIQHIEPQHIADLPVPRLGHRTEQAAHEHVTSAACARARASQLLADASERFALQLGLSRERPLRGYGRPATHVVRSSGLARRLDAFYYAPWNVDARTAWDSSSAPEMVPLGDASAQLYIPGIFKRQYAEDPAHGYPYLTGSSVYELAPTSDRYLLRRIADSGQLVLREGMVAIQDSGQLGGLIGRAVGVGSYLDGFAATNNMVRIVPRSRTDQGYLLALLRSEYGLRLLCREATGSSIPHLEEGRVSRIMVPWPDATIREEVASPVLDALSLRDQACEHERAAIELVEACIEEDTP